MCVSFYDSEIMSETRKPIGVVESGFWNVDGQTSFMLEVDKCARVFFFVIVMLFNECPYVSPIYVFQIYLKVIKDKTSDGECKDGNMCGLSGLVHGR